MHAKYGSGSTRDGWKTTGYRRKTACERCGSKNRLRVHHKDRNPKNNHDHNNLETLCMTCHTREHKQEILSAQRKLANRKRLSEQAKLAWRNKKNRKLRLSKQKAYWADPINRKAQAERTQKVFQNPEAKRRLVEGVTKSWTKTRRKQAATITKQLWADGKFKKTNKAYWQNPRWRASMSEKFKEAWKLRKQKLLKGKGHAYA